MHRCHHGRREWRIFDLSALTSHAEFAPQQRLRCRRTEADENMRLHHPKFSVEPGAASMNFGVSRLFVNAFLSSLSSHPFEMLNDIRQENVRPFNSCFFQCLVEQSAGRTDKRMAGQVFLIAGLFADEHDPRF